MAKKRAIRRRKKAAAKSIGLSPAETAAVKDAGAERLAEQVVADGGAFGRTTATGLRTAIIGCRR